MPPTRARRRTRETRCSSTAWSRHCAHSPTSPWTPWPARAGTRRAETAWPAPPTPWRTSAGPSTSSRAAGADVIHHPLPAHAYAPGAPPQVVTVHDLGFELLAANFSPNHRRYAARRPPRRAPAGVQYEALLTDVYEAARPGALPEYLLEPDAALAS